MTIPASQQLFDEDEEGTIDMNQYSQQKQSEDDFDDEEGTIDMSTYSKSKEAEQAGFWDHAREAGIQSVLGFGQAFTYPLDLLKLGMIGEGLTDIDELEDAFKKAGKPFDKDKYIKTVMEQGEFIPTQELLENFIQDKSGVNLEPKTKTGKAFRKFFQIVGFTKGKGLKTAAKAGAVGATTTEGLRQVGAPEIVAELGGDIAGGAAAIEKELRQLSPESARIQRIADKHGLPLMEVMLEDEVSRSAKISPARRAALESELGMSLDQAITLVIEDRLPISRLRAQGQDLEVLEDAAYLRANTLAQANPAPLNTTEIIRDIDSEIARIESLAPSPSNAQNSALNVLRSERELLLDTTPNTSQLVNQTQNYNSNVKSIYRKPEFSGAENEVRQAYAFMNRSISNTIENQAGPEVAEAYRAANLIYGQNANLARTEGIICSAFQDGHYNPKKLNQILNSKKGELLRRDIGDQGARELREIAEFGEKAQKATKQFSNSAKHKFQLGDWGPLAGFILAKVPPAGAAAVAAKPFFDYVRGWALTRPAARTAYRNIVKNASEGSFKNMAKDFAVLESEVIKEYGSIDEFMKQGINDLQFYEEGEED